MASGTQWAQCDVRPSARRTKKHLTFLLLNRQCPHYKHAEGVRLKAEINSSNDNVECV